MGNSDETLEQSPGLMTGRHDPIGDFPMTRKLEYLEAISVGLGEAWLSSTEENPIRDLWRRTDWLATSELFHFGSSICDVRAHGADKWLSDHMHRIRSGDLPTARGSIFEICAASMLSAGGQQVQYAKPNQAGFDLVLGLSSAKTLRVSCKVLSDSAYSRRFSLGGRSLFRDLREGVAATTPIHVYLIGTRWAPPLPTGIELVTAVRGALLIARSQETQLGSWRLLLDRLKPFSFAGFSRVKTSVGLNIVAPHQRSEQKRFDDKMNDACENLSKHAPRQDAGAGNVVFMKIPEGISLETAVEYTRAGPLSAHREVAGAILLRTLVCSNGKEIGLGHQLRVVGNPSANFPIAHYAPSGALKLNFLTGVIPDVQSLDTPDRNYRLPIAPHRYSFERQHHHYETEIRASNANVDTPPFLLGLSCDWTLVGDKQIDLRFDHTVPERELIIL